MRKIIALTQRDHKTIKSLLSIWESSVKATHLFLTEKDIEAIKPDVENALIKIEHLFYCETDKGIDGFIGAANQKIEMLFVDANSRGQGIGTLLLNYAVNCLDSKYVDVNEQNTQGVGFYKGRGFRQINRSELDGQGRPFPLLHLKRP